MTRPMLFRIGILAALVLTTVAPLVSAQESDIQPLTLGEAVRLATDASQSVERSRLDVTVARSQVDGAKAAFGPTVTGSAGIAYLADPAEGITIPAGEFGTVTNPGSTFPARLPDEPVVLLPDAEHLGLSARVELRQPLFTWGKLTAGREAAEAGLDAGVAGQGRSERELRRRVSLAYAGVVAGRASLERVEELVALLESRAANAREQYEAGAITRSEVLSQESVLAGARAQLVRVRQGLRSGEATLEWLVDREIGALTPPELPDDLPDEDALVRRAIEGDPQLAELRATSGQAAVQLRVARASRPLLPDLGLSVTAEVQGQRIPFVQSNWIDSWDADLTVSIGASATLYDSGANRADQTSAQAQYEQALSAIAEYEDSLPLQIRAAMETFRVAEARLAEAVARRETAAEQLRVAEVSYENELITRAELLGARAAVLEAELTGISARLEMARGVIELEYLAGPLLEEPT
ncbi:MAG: TolC family protein [Spirochaetota bacterium]